MSGRSLAAFELAWRCEGLRFSYPEAPAPAVDGISLGIPAAICTGIIGPNGSGKSTLLKLLLGVLEPSGGTIELEGRALTSWSRLELARHIGVVPQGEEISFPLTVRELVAMGRYPHLGSWRREGSADRDAIRRAMERCDVAAFADRPIATLSGGERQRVRVARALAQEPAILALDEPTVALDLRHEMAIFELLRELAAAGVTVLLVTHNLNLAARYADRLIVLESGSLAGAGDPGSLLRSDLLERIYRWPVRITPHPGPGHDTGAPQLTALARQATNEIIATRVGDPSHTSHESIE